MKAIVLSVAISAAALVSSACDAPGTPDPAPIDDKSCTLDVDCDADAVCRANLCVQDLGGGGNPGAGEGEGEGEDLAPGFLTVLPDDDVDFGATRIGTAPERTVTLKNTGDAALDDFSDRVR